MPDDLTSTVGIIAMAAGALALLGLALATMLGVKLRRLRSSQALILGESGQRDLVEHAESMQRGFEALRADVERSFQKLDQRLGANEQRLQRCVSNTAVVRYDAYDEMSGHQSSSLALLDETGTGLVLSSILHREQARTYVKGVHGGEPDVELSPEESDAIDKALGRERQAKRESA
jgi:hypothetical protein